MCNFIAIPKKYRCYCSFVLSNEKKQTNLYSLASEL